MTVILALLQPVQNDLAAIEVDRQGACRKKFV
jgi:hypothetical protein